MSRHGPRGSIAMALAIAVMGIGGTAGLVAVVKSTSQPSQPTPTAQPTQPKVAPKPTDEGNMPIAFRDPENTQHWLALRPKVDAMRTSIAALDKATAIPSDDLEEACSGIFRDANPLAGEGHKAVRSYADGAKRLCDYDRSLALLRLFVRVQKASPPKGKDDKRARCDFAAKSVKRLIDRGCSDDEKVKTELAEVGKACI
jgi:hypothetical protein